MIAAKTFIARMNEGRANWLSDDEILSACKEFFNLNGYAHEQERVFEGTNSDFVSPLSGSREFDGRLRTMGTFFQSRIEKYDMSLFGSIESALYTVLDGVDDSEFALVTDSFSYSTIVNHADINVAIENLMDEGMYILFVNDRSEHALFDRFEKLVAPVPL